MTSKPNAAQQLAADLAMLAKAATPGPWVTDGEYVNEHGNVTHSYVSKGRRAGGRIAGALANCLVKTDEQCRANAAFIAGANPKAVQALLAEIARLEVNLDTMASSAKAVREEWRIDQAECAALRSQVKTLQSDANSWQAGYDEGRRMGAKTASADRGALDHCATRNENKENVSRHETR